MDYPTLKNNFQSEPVVGTWDWRVPQNKLLSFNISLDTEDIFTEKMDTERNMKYPLVKKIIFRKIWGQPGRRVNAFFIYFCLFVFKPIYLANTLV